MTATAEANSPPKQEATLPRLLPHHLAKLRASGLTDETIKASGIYSETVYTKLAAILDWRKLPKKMAPAIVIPYFTADGQSAGYARIRPDTPRKQNGKPVKYESPQGQPNKVYFPPGIGETSESPTAELLFTEGEFKSAASTQAGFPCIGLPGVYGWKDKHREALLPVLDRIPLKGRPVYLAFDNDGEPKPEVEDALRRLAAQLTSRGATVRVVRLPAGPDDADGKPTKMGLDDFLVAHGENGPLELRKLLDAAEPPEPVAPLDMMTPAKDLDPAHEAAAFLNRLKVKDVPRLRFWQSSFWYWRDGAYAEQSEDEMRARVVLALNQKFFKMNGGHIGNTLDQLKAQSILSFSTVPPAWLTKTPPRPWKPQDILSARNGLIHLPTLVVGGSDYMLPATPLFFTPVALDYTFALDAPPPTAWLAFLSTLWPDDAESIATLQEWMGYCLTPDTRQHKILCLLGPPRSGKGTIARVQRALIGPANVCSPTLASLATNFGLWSFIGRTLAVISDARLSGKTDGSIVVERLLSISGEDALTIDRKFAPPVTTRLLTRLMILSNELPRLVDASGAIASRMIVLRLTESFINREDHGLEAKLLPELPAILLWAVEGWRRLQERGYFVQPESGKKKLADLGDIVSPVGGFIRECCHVGPEYSVDRKELFAAYVTWAKAEGRDYILDQQGFGRDLHAILPRIRTIQRKVDGERPRYYRGIGLRLGF